MMRYGYLSDGMLGASGSVVAYDAETCLKAVDRVVLGMLSFSEERTGT
jgi:hypothetical protein